MNGSGLGTPDVSRAQALIVRVSQIAGQAQTLRQKSSNLVNLLGAESSVDRKGGEDIEPSDFLSILEGMASSLSRILEEVYEDLSSIESTYEIEKFDGKKRQVN